MATDMQIKNILFFIGLILVNHCVRGQSINSNQVKKQMVSLFEIDQDTTGGQTYRYERIVVLPSNNIFADLVKNNEQYVSYIKENYSTIDYPKIRSSNTDLKQVNQALYQAFEQDLLYNQCASELAYYYLYSKGIRVIDYKPSPKQTVSKAELMRIASRFFYAHSVEETPDSIGFHVCVGMNGYQHNRKLLTNPLVEAFCFMALFQNLHNPNYSYWSYFVKQVKRIRANYKTVSDPTQRIEAARQEMYELMKNNKELERALLVEYARKRRMLNFVLEE